MLIVGFWTLGLYSLVSGFKDGILYSKTGAEAFTWNEHIVFTIERAIICLILLCATKYSFVDALAQVGAFALSFSMFHNSGYYYSRAKIANAPFDITYSSTTSTAKIELGFKARLAGAIIGLLGIVAYSIFIAG